jgi:Flp pilus assembly pilin Flp
MILTPKHILRRFGRSDRGAAALEFAMVAPVLIALLFGTIETGWTMVQTMMLDRALDTTVRALRIGDMVNPTQQTMRRDICRDALVLIDCEANLALEFIPIVTSASYPNDNTRCVDRTGRINPVLRFNSGTRSQTVFIRACFMVRPMIPGVALGLALPKDETGAYRIIAKSGFVNEPS